MRVYIASKLNNIPRVRLLSEMLRARGHSLTYDWTVNGPAYKESASVAENNRTMRGVAEAELGGIALADAVIVLLPGGRGTHVEIGAALALNKPVLIVGSESDHYPGLPCAFYRHPFVRMVASDVPAIIADELASLA